MTTFNDRERDFEARFKHDQEFAFKVTARRNRLLGLWAAGQLGLAGDAAESYAKEVVAADFDKPGPDDMIDKVLKDLGAKGVQASRDRVHAELSRCAVEAKKQLMQG
jgi:hypothetical protein